MTSTTPEARPRRFRPGIWLRAAALTAVAVHPAASLASRWSWPGDLLSHFQEPALALTVAVALALLLRRPRWLAAPLLALAVFQAVPLVRYSGANPRPADPDRPHRLRILMANVLYQNDDATGLTRLIRAERPDVVGLVEFTEGWRDGLESVRGDYPYRVEYPGGPSGLALWFRERPAFLGDPDWLVPPPGNPVIHARFEFAGGPREFWLVHPRSPLKRPIGEPGNPEVEALGAAVAGAAGSRIVVGDMNSTDEPPLPDRHRPPLPEPRPGRRRPPPRPVDRLRSSAPDRRPRAGRG